MRILVIDPDWNFLGQARSFLESRGHHLVNEPNPERGIDRCRHWHPDVALVSAELDACCDGQLLPRLGALQPRPAIILTAGLERFDKAWRAWQRGGDEVLFKPLMHPSELHVAIVTAMENAVCPRARQRASQPKALSA